MEKELLTSEIKMDFLYNHKAICEKLLQGNEDAAIDLFLRQSRELDSVPADQLSDYRCIFLTSLNRCLYYFILFSWNISLSNCCFEGRSMAHNYNDRESFQNSGIRIIRAYGNQLRENSSCMKYITNALTYIEDHLNDELTLSTVSSHIYISPCYLCKLFKNLMGKNFANYVTEQRIGKAKKLLQSSEYRLELIASKCGFRTASYFSSQFHKFCGVTPTEYRNQCRKINLTAEEQDA